MKSAKELGITIKERNALVKVRDGLRNGEYRHVKDPYSARKSAKKNFRMHTWLSEYEYDCGTIGCIGGWCTIAMKVEADYSFSQALDCSQLFFPYGVVQYWDAITPKKAAKAIDNFLNGEAPWEFMRPASDRMAA